jgi:peptide deformylase
MNKHHIIYFGHETLARAASRVEDFTPDIPELVKEMFVMLDQAKGIGLAAPQINVDTRIIVIDLSHYEEGPRIAVVNPEIVWKSDEVITYEEGCLSVPGIYCEVSRSEKVSVKGFSPEGKAVQFKADGILARVLQHEIDHLDGILFVDRIDAGVRKEYTKELRQIKKMNKK